MKTKKQMASKTGEGGFAAKSVALSSLFGAVLCAGMLCLFALLISCKDLPLGIMGPMAVLSLILGCLFAGFLCSRMMNCRGMMWGGVCGTVLFLFVVAAQGFCADAGFGIAVLPKFVMMLTSGMIGGVFGVNLRGR
ncbi:MAG: TIGR04086 family membrane protein [Oscillospiraceae bacterium]|nr:TIGR04086 family membrane protein [Oscillospiraceae bacterium]